MLCARNLIKVMGIHQEGLKGEFVGVCWSLAECLQRLADIGNGERKFGL